MFSGLRSLIASVGTKRLPVFEMAANTVQMPRLARAPSWANVTEPKDDLSFSGIQLAHSVIKADFLDYRNPLLPGIGFVLQSHDIVDWQSQDFCLKPGASKILNDFVLTSLAGRIGQGLAILFCHNEKLCFTAHLRQFLESRGILTRDANGELLPIADFVFDGPGNRAIVEAKASLSIRKNEPSRVKSIFKKALETQVNPWMPRVNPSATKSFVISTYLREKPDPAADPSALVFVDPSRDGGNGDIVLSREAVCRENYAAWLSAMGLVDEANRLRQRQIEGHEKSLFVVYNIAGLPFAFPIDVVFPSRLLFDCHPGVETHVGHMSAGIHLDALYALRDAAAGDEEALLRYPAPMSTRSNSNDDYAYSIFPDGTFLGSFSPRPLDDVVEVSL